MESPARPASAAVSGAFGLSPDHARCSFDQTLRREDFQDNRLRMSLVNIHEQENYSREIITEAVENCMKKQADNLVHSLDVISGRLSQLELYCYKLERSIGELRSDVMDYHGEANLNFSFLEKHVIEVQKSVQVLQDKQELAESQKELTKLHILHEESTQKSEGTAPSIIMTKENDGSMPVAKHELALVPLHQVNAVQSPAMQFQSCNGLVLQQLVPVSLSTQQDQQHLNQATMYYMQSQNHVEHRQAQPFQPAPQSVQRHTQNPQPQTVVEVPQLISQAPEFYLQAQQQWPHQTVSHCPRNMGVQPSSSTISSSQRNHHEVAPIYVQSSAISGPLAENNLQHQQPQQLQPLGGSFKPSKVSLHGVTSYTVQGSAQAYNNAFGNPSNNAATVVAVLPQQAQSSAPMVLHHLGPQSVQNHPVDMVEMAARMGYFKDQTESMTLRMATVGQPVEFKHLA
ncbi:hypothetical protein GUJ93_ZPchr0005g14713 [Zizania palustris]|uniref:DUF1421 domain-containing protein n=1 Tax=Zizania palustris TaxID=103762 RepID=A0A8J5SYG0_ZIZPA|nr:hypothetical protein GUJ93_ZPchr0005g14713 [Zizania palustris]